MQHNGVYYDQHPGNSGSSLLLTVFDGISAPVNVRLNPAESTCVYFGRSDNNQIVLKSHLVSGQHGRFVFRDGNWFVEDKAMYSSSGSTNGLIYNHRLVRSACLGAGCFFRIDASTQAAADGVLFMFSAASSNDRWSVTALNDRNSLLIGRDAACDIRLEHISVSRQHARLVLKADGWYIVDNNSTNGVIVNGMRVNGSARLYDRDIIFISSCKLIFTQVGVFYFNFKSGISVDTDQVVIKRKDKKGWKVTCDHVSLGVRPGELVSIVGGSGAGKSTVLNCMCGYLEPAAGHVYINGVDLYSHFDTLKSLIGYVPQQDIVYDNLSLYDMLMYTAKLRLPKDTSPEEQEAAINRAIATVELTEKKDALIKALSGGQRKRASIAVELLSDPKLLFLDEPASGLDPGTERSLMNSLRRMADEGKTIILVTHSTLQLQMCDKVVFMGKGGKLCFCGSYSSALAFFGAKDVVDIYSMINDFSTEWSNRYKASRGHQETASAASSVAKPVPKQRLRQLGVLSARYIKLVLNDRQRLLLLLLQAPLLAALISFVADGEQFVQYEMTKSLLFALSCSAFWVGMLNAIQEICKERTILKREYMTGLSLSSYISSKILVLGFMCVIQSLLLTGVFALLVGLPDEGVMMAPFLELLLTTFITALASTAMGLFVSSLFTNADRAMTIAPILLMPQILFSGLIFKLSGATEVISWAAICRWSMEGYGTTANLNDLPLRLQQAGIMLPQEFDEFEKFYEFTSAHMLTALSILLGFTVLFLVLSRLVLTKIGKEGA